MFDGKYFCNRLQDFKAEDMEYIFIDEDQKNGLISNELHSDNALLYQVRTIISNEKKESIPQDFYRDIIFYIDFSTCQLSDAKEFFDSGIYFYINDKKVHYVPFEKSNSQAKDQICSFIREDFDGIELFQTLKERIDLGLYFGDYETDNKDLVKLSQPNLSKLYAYRGLYLSDADRIFCSKSDLLNENSIIVINECALGTDKSFSNKDIYTVENDYDTKNNQIILKEKTITDDREKKEALHIKMAFDGEGLISALGCAYVNYTINGKQFDSLYRALNLSSPKARIKFLTVFYEYISTNRYNDLITFTSDEYAKELEANNISAQIINELLLDCSVNSTYSFQFRLPFAKGVLHLCNWNCFYKNSGIEKLHLQDHFGIERDVLNANIILTTSMFKLKSLGFNKDLVNNSSNDIINIDPMKYYFDKMEDYDHSLYIGNRDTSFHNRSGRVNISYQQLNTLQLSEEEFLELTNQHIDYANRFIPNNVYHSKQLLPENEKWMSIINDEKRMLFDEYYLSKINQYRKSILNNIFEGKISVSGNMRFASRDLLYFLYHISVEANKISKQVPDDIIKQLNNHKITRGYIYAPQYDCKSNTLVSILRSPHLSRSENIGAKMIIGSALHEQYFSHLKGVIMIPIISHMNDSAGGCDFDGDELVLTDNKTIALSCLKEGYNELSKNDKETIEENYKIKIKELPIVYIPSFITKGTNKTHTSKYIDFITIQNTFSSRVGKISNAALKLAALKYTSTGTQLHSPELLTVAVGVEIDSCKNGSKPFLDEILSSLSDKNNKSANQKIIESISTYIKLIKTINPNNDEYISIKKEEKNCIAFLDKTYNLKYDSSLPNIVNLPYLWAKAIYNDNNAKNNSVKLDDNLKPMDIRNSIFGTKQKSSEFYLATREMFSAYNKAIKLYKDYRKLSNYIEDNYEKGKIFNILFKQYGDIFVKTKSTIFTQSIESVYNRLQLKLNNDFDNAKTIIETIYNANFFNTENINKFWPFMGKTEALDFLSELSDNFSEEQKELISNFKNRGYNLFYYMLIIAIGYNKSEQQKGIIDHFEDVNSQNETNKKYNQIILNEMVKIIHLSIQDKLPPKTWNDEIIKLIKTQISGLKNDQEENISEEIRTIYPPLSGSYDLFWSLYSWDDFKNTMEDSKNA